MKSQRKRRLIWVIVLVLSFSLAATLVLYALRQNIDLYYTPSQALKAHVSPSMVFRMGGIVEQGSVKRSNHSLAVSFTLTDYAREIVVEFTGILPALFRAGQGIIVQGKLNSQGVFVADQVLAKHDNQYRPPEISDRT